MLLMDRDKMSNLYRVSVHMVEGFQRRRLKCEKLTDDRRQTPSDGKSSHCLWQGELKMLFLETSISYFKTNPKTYYSGTCAFRHPSSPTSCDIGQKCMTPK
jgi:hypothetical protein